ncbi:MAG: hypothetical protein PUI75_00340, partial [Subdoligranulum sp.]|nr:hypothetical protein [Subdoligranulum sp.]MDD6947481.1 hypothetical protein [Subdoligranulum sp.]MDY6124823.1 hypothetical protein [Gemmiger qucibialis]
APLRRLRHGICVAKILDNTQSIICAFGLASAAPRSPYRHLELCGIATNQTRFEKIEKCPLRLGFGRNGRGRRRRCAAAVQGTAGCDIIEETGR